MIQTAIPPCEGWLKHVPLLLGEVVCLLDAADVDSFAVLDFVDVPQRP